MQVEELGLFSGGKCNKAVEDKLALEVFDLYMKIRKEFDRCAFVYSVDDIKLTTQSFDVIENLLEESILISFLPKLNAILQTIKKFKINRDRASYYHSTTVYYVVALNNILDYLKPIIFASTNTQIDYQSEFIQDDKYVNYDTKFKAILHEELEKVTLKQTIYI